MERSVKYAFRITHIENIPHILKYGFVHPDSPNAILRMSLLAISRLSLQGRTENMKAMSYPNSSHRAMYGPYSGKVCYVLRYLNGSYVMGLSALQQKAFDEIWILPNTSRDASEYLKQSGNEKYRDLSEKVKAFLRGYYTNYTLELLSTVDFLLMSDTSLKGWLKEDDIEVNSRLIDDISDWNERKKRMFNNPAHVRMMTEHLRKWNRKGLLGFD